MTGRARRTDAAWIAVVVLGAVVSLAGIGWLVTLVYRAWPGPEQGGDTAVPTQVPAGSARAADRPSLPATPPALPPSDDRTPEPPEGASAALTEAALVAMLRARSLTVPVSGVSRHALVPAFHEARGAGVHEALDIIAPAGTPVLAVEDGTVARLFTSAAGGLTIYQFDPSRLVTYYYAHLERYADGLTEGARVTRGQVLGYVGTTGNADRSMPHLHFAIFRLGPDGRWWEGDALDPFEVLKD